MSKAAMQIAAAVGAIVLTLASVVWFGGRSPASAPEQQTDQQQVARQPVRRTLTIYVSGEVARPGLIQLSEGARVADAVAAAGGVLPSGNLAALNLASTLTDGQHICVPSQGGSGPVSQNQTDARVSLSTASAEELTTLPGVGPVLAQRIIEHRESYGPFTEVEDLLDVPGIGEGRLAALRDMVVP